MKSYKALSFVVVTALVCAAAPANAQESAGGASGVDQTFINQFVHANDREIEQARAELQATQDPNVVLFARTIINDHTTANSQAGAVARGLGLSFPTSHIAVGSHPATGSMAAPTGAMAPRAYMTMQVQEHQAAIGLLQGEADNGSSAQLRTLAAQTLPVVKAHLAMAQQYLQTGRVSPEATPAPGT